MNKNESKTKIVYFYGGLSEERKYVIGDYFKSMEYPWYKDEYLLYKPLNRSKFQEVFTINKKELKKELDFLNVTKILWLSVLFGKLKNEYLLSLSSLSSTLEYIILDYHDSPEIVYNNDKEILDFIYAGDNEVFHINKGLIVKKKYRQ